MLIFYSLFTSSTTVVRALAPQLHIPLVLGAAPEDIPVVPTTSGSMYVSIEIPLYRITMFIQDRACVNKIDMAESATDYIYHMPYEDSVAPDEPAHRCSLT